MVVDVGGWLSWWFLFPKHLFYCKCGFVNLSGGGGWWWWQMPGGGGVDGPNRE